MKITTPLFLAAACCAQTLPPGTIAGFDAKAIDAAVKPCDDFYQYACGTWLKNNPIPGDQSAWGRFSELAERNQLTLKAILEKASAQDSSRNAIQRQIGDFYAACMDEAAIEKKGVAAIRPELDRIEALGSPASIATELARLHTFGINALFGFSSGQDFKDSTEVIAQWDQAGLVFRSAIIISRRSKVQRSSAEVRRPRSQNVHPDRQVRRGRHIRRRSGYGLLRRRWRKHRRTL